MCGIRGRREGGKEGRKEGRREEGRKEGRKEERKEDTFTELLLSEIRNLQVFESFPVICYGDSSVVLL